MAWQHELRDELIGRLPVGAAGHVTGSVADGDLDGWSDLDLHLDLAGRAEPLDLLAELTVWACSEELTEAGQVLRVVLADGRRLDLVITGGHVRVPPLAPDNDIRFLAALAAAKLGRGDHLIGLHLTLDLLRSCLVLAMQLRDRDLGTTIHRQGSDHDALAGEVAAILAEPLSPELVVGVVDLYAGWRTSLDPSYEPVWSALRALIARGNHPDPSESTLTTPGGQARPTPNDDSPAYER